MTTEDQLIRVMAEAPCIEVSGWHCGSRGRPHVECAAAALRAHFASEEVRERAGWAIEWAEVSDTETNKEYLIRMADAALAAFGLAKQP